MGIATSAPQNHVDLLHDHPASPTLSRCHQCAAHSALAPRLLNKQQVLQRTGIKAKTTLDDLIRQGEFPRASAYMNRKPFWTLEAVDTWIDGLIAKTAAERGKGR